MKLWKKIRLLRKNTLNRYSKKLVVFSFSASFFFSLMLTSSFAQVSITGLGTTYRENFNGMFSPGSGPTLPLPNGFKFGADWNIALTNGTSSALASAGTAGALNNISGNLPNFYNFGYGSNDTSTDRALGFFTSATYKSPRSILFAFTNNTGSTVTKIDLSWNYEKYRNGTLTNSGWKFYHGASKDTYTYPGTVSSTTSTNVTSTSIIGVFGGMMISGNPSIPANAIVTAAPAGSLIPISSSGTTFTSINTTYSWTATNNEVAGDTTYTVADLDLLPVTVPNSGAKSFTISGLSIPNGSTYYLRWMYNSGSNSVTNAANGKALGIDDFTITLKDDRCYPYTQARLDSVTVGASRSLNVNYTRGNGNNILIVASTSATPTAPTNNVAYTSNSIFGSGSPIGAGYVVYNGVGNGVNAAHTVNVTNLNSSTPYYFYLYEYNSAGICYHPTVVSGSGFFSGSTDYFRSRTSGNWNIPATWESSIDNISWITANAKPDSLSRGIIIRSPDSVAIAAAETAKNLTINLGATLSYNTAITSSGSPFSIANDPANEFDFNIYGRYIIFGTPATLIAGAKVKIFGGGLVRADNNTGGLSDNFAFNQNIYFTNGSVFEWNNTSGLNSSNSVYFNYLGAQPTADIPTFRFSKAPSTPLGAGANTRINGITEINAPTGQLAFQSAGLKFFRNGITGTGTLSQNATCGQFVISGLAVLGGNGAINLSNAGLRIADTSVTTLLSDKPINGASPAAVMLDGSFYTSTFAITGTSPFTVSSTAKLYIGSPNGISASAASGNIQSTGTRTYNAAAAYHYYGTTNQVTGDGLPLTITGSLNISNSGTASNNIVTLSVSGTTTSTLNLNAGLFACGTSGILNISNAGFINGNSGNILNDPAAGTINFPGNGTVDGSSASVNFYNVTISNGVNFGATITSIINNLLCINPGGWVKTNAPVYNSGSTLKYNTGGSYGRSTEFSATTGKGYPFNVQISNNTAFDLGNGGTDVARQIAGSLTTDVGSGFYMDFGSNDCTVPLSVLGNVTNNGSLSLSDASGGDIRVGGNWTRGVSGIFNHKGRAVIFNGTTSNQIITVTGGGTENFGYLIINKLSTTSLVLSALPATDITINGGNGGNAFQMLDGNMDLNGRTFNFIPFNIAINNIGIDGTTANTTRRISSTIAGGLFNIYNNDVFNPRVVSVNRQSAAASLLSFGSGTTLVIGGLSQNSGINFGAGVTTILGSLQINTWGYVETNPAFYGLNSNLVYNAGGPYKRFTEWSTASGAGYPFNITVQNNTQLRINDDGPGQNGTADRSLAGTLTIQNGATATLGDSTENNKLTIGRDLLLNGTLNMPSSIAAIGADLYIAGNWNRSVTGVFNHNERAVFFNGASNATITAANGQYFPYLYLQKATAANTLSLLDNISIGKIFTINSGKFDLASKDATLLSTPTFTAQFGPVGVNADVLYSGIGRFVVERYLPTGNGIGQHGKSWQFLAIPTNGGQTINQAWQEGANSPNQNPNPGYGTQITGNNGGNTAGATALGFDAYSPGGPSMKTYNINGTWSGVSNTRTQPIYDARGYMVFVRGDRSVNAINQTATSTKLRTRGQLFVPVSNPPTDITISAGSFQSLGNPYASAIDFTQLDVPGVPNVDPVYYVWDPLLTGTNGLGGYQTFSANNPVCDYCAFPGGTANYSSNVQYKNIQSGQAFLMHATGAGGTVSFSESVKATGSSNPFRVTSPTSDKKYLQIYLHSGSNDDAPVADATSVVFSSSYTNNYDHNDALKLTNTGENLGILLSGKKLAIETRGLVMRNDSIQLDLSNLRRQGYQFKFNPGRFNGLETNIQLIDRTGQATTSISTSDSTYVNFNVTADPASYRSDRFYILFAKSRVGQNTPLAKDNIAKSIISTTFDNQPTMTIAPNCIQDGTLHLSFVDFPKGLYPYTILATNGQQVTKGTISLGVESENRSINIHQLSKGSYQFVVSGLTDCPMVASFMVL